MITSFAIFYDVEDPNQFCADIKNILKPDGVWVCQLSYLPLMLKNLTFDQICHEHITYYTLSVFKKIVEKHNLKIIDEKVPELPGGAHRLPKEQASILKKTLLSNITNLESVEIKELIKNRNKKYLEITSNI